LGGVIRNPVEHPAAHTATLDIRITGSDAPFTSGTSMRSIASYTRARYSLSPMIVAPNSKRRKPASIASFPHASRMALPMPRRAHSGSTKNARILAAPAAGSTLCSTSTPPFCLLTSGFHPQRIKGEALAYLAIHAEHRTHRAGDLRRGVIVGLHLAPTARSVSR